MTRISEGTEIHEGQEHPPAEGTVVQQGSSHTSPSTPVSEERSSAIALSPDGILAPTTHTEAWRIAKTFLDSKAIPKQFQNTAQVFMALQFLRGLGFEGGTEVAALRQCTIINGSLSLWGELPLALARRSGNLEWIRESFYTEDYQEICFDNKNLDKPPFFARCQIKRSDQDIVIERVFSVSDAKTAGLWGKSGPWQSYPNRMLQMRVRSWALKDSFPDALYGIAIAEYDHNTLFEGGGSPLKITEPAHGSVADELNKNYLEADDGQI